MYNLGFCCFCRSEAKTGFILLLVFTLCGQLVYGARYFPELIDLAALKPITASSTCGSTSSRYCTSGTSSSSVQVCQEKTCKLGCCGACGSKTPARYDLGQGTRIEIENGSPRNGSSVASFRFPPGRRSWIRPSDIPFIEYVSKGLSVSVWTKQVSGNKGIIVSKLETRSPFTQVYSLITENYKIWFYYRTSGSNTTFVEVEPLASDRQKLNLVEDQWHFISVTVVNTDLVYFIDGEYVRGATLNSPIQDDGGVVYVGRKDQFTDTNQYEGLMQDLYMYPQALTNREVIEAFSGKLPQVYIESQCRCPPTYPKIKPDKPGKCVKNGEIQENEVSRISDTAHPVELVTDNVLASYWLSQLTDEVSIDVNMEYGELQVFHVLMTFYGPFPKGIKIEKSVDQGQSYKEWQYFASDCPSTFGLDDNGALTQPDSVNCIKYSSPLPYDQGQIVFRTEQPPPAGSPIPLRPFGAGCNLLYCSEKLLEFLKATNIRLRFYNHTLVRNAKHEYFGLRRIHVTGRCECHGHATDVSYIKGNATHKGTCVCKCVSSTNTEGDKCERCKPLYNKKPFKRGDNSDSYSCVKCECNDHASSCYYNSSLDPSPSSRTRGGGGVCIDCRHNTEGRFCHVCKENYYRESGKNIKATDVCTLCNCVGVGVQSGKTNCTKDDSTPGVSAGQCHCKANTQGRQCDQCKPGFYDLKAGHAGGCVACGCNADGTRGGNASCHATSGQCYCKTNVQGMKCNQCKPGHFNLKGSNSNGCETCNCDPFGSKNGTICDSSNGQCVCKTGSTGQTCHGCADGYHSPSAAGCKPCNCSEDGIQAALLNSCDKSNGQCQCRQYVTGTKCDRCKDGYFGLDKSKADGCTLCSCDPKGTVTGAGRLCEIQSGNCTCKRYVVGQTCNQCRLGTYGLNQSNPDGCVKCNCFPKGTTDGDKNHPDELTCSSNGQCSCLSNVNGLQCDACADQYYWNPAGQGCVPCNCHVTGSVAGTSCNVTTGQCVCQANVGGTRCDRCSPGHYGFNNGQCQACNCNSSGSVSSVCDSLGQCTCKQNVQGRKCDTCKPNTVNLQAGNMFGCSGAPSEQPPPVATAISSRAIQLAWSPPDNPNGIILRYELYRNNTLIYSSTARELNDTGLIPYTLYTYHIITFTERGSARSLGNAKARTFGDIPGGISVPRIFDVFPRSAKATWVRPTSPNGHIVEYRLVSVNSRSAAEQTHCQGLIFGCDLTTLKPYTVYNFTLVVCTRAGCGRSDPSMDLTKPTRPESQPSPVVTSLPGGRDVRVTWDEPAEPNGRIFRYELYMRRTPFVGNWLLKFQSFPLNDPQNPNLRNTNVTSLTPFTKYEFLVRSYTAQVAGDTPSNATRHRTGEATPQGASAMAPTATAVSATSVRLAWRPPQTPHGIIIRYEIYRYEASTNFGTEVKTREVNGTAREAMLNNLQPFVRYKFTVKACNSYACSEHSGGVFVTTAAGAPAGQGPPTALTLDSTTIALNWSEPAVLNGPPPPTYRLHRAFAAFYYPPPSVTAGVHFPGLGYYKFPGDFVQSGISNNIEFHFRTPYADGLIMFLASAFEQRDILVLELRNGKLWFIFDCQDSLVAFTVAQAVRFDDNEFHHVKATRTGKTGTLLIDGIKYSATATSNGISTVIPSNTGVYVGGLPDGFRIVRSDASQVTSKLNFVGCLRTVKSDGKLFQWDKAIHAVSVDPILSGCPAREKTPGVFLRGGGYVVVKRGIFTGGNIFTLHFSFRTELRTGLVFFAHSSTAYMALRLGSNGSAIEIKISTPTTRVSYTAKPASGVLSDGKWHQVEVTSIAVNLAVVIDGESTVFQPLTQLVINSDLYVGGVPRGTNAVTILTQSGLDPDASFGGCISNIEVIPRKVNPIRDVTSMMNADLDGCRPNTTSSSGSSGATRNSTVVYEDTAERFNDTELHPFTDYLYRVESFHPGTAGSAKSTWVAVQSGQGAPSGIAAPTQLLPLVGGRSVHVTWTAPQTANGVLTKFVILAYDTSSPGSKPVESTFTDTSSLNGTIAGLKPYTTYDIKIAMYTFGGSAVGPGRNVRTEQAVPEGVPSPSAERRPRSLYLNWSAPASENGVITGYNLSVNGQLVYSGTDRNFTVMGLSVYTAYSLKLTACTVVGCEDGPTIVIYTGELAPEGFDPPHLATLGPNTVEVMWSQPRVPNGVVVRYEVFIATIDVTSEYESRYNGSRAHLSTILRNLTAGTLYFIRVKVYSGGGGTLSNASTVTTKPDVPAEIPPPEVTPISPYALFVRILPPRKPNGIIIRYELHEDGRLVLNGTATNYTAEGFEPFTLHKFRVRACTVVGCSSSPEGQAYTLEIAPNGTVKLNSSIFNATAVRARWSRVAVPNGNLFYNLMINGRFLSRSSQELLTEVRVERAISTQAAERMFTYNGLIAFNNYSVWVNASNSVGFVLSNAISVTTPEHIPGGFKAPNVTVLSSTSVHVTWMPPALPNGILLGYQLHQREATLSSVERVIYEGNGLNTHVLGLSPYTEYEFRVSANTSVGPGFGPISRVTTMEDVPGTIDPPSAVHRDSFFIVLGWSPPTPPNGVLLHYIVYQNGSEVARVAGNATQHRVTALQPYALYVFSLGVCTKIGCRNSSASLIQTLESVPDGLSPPRLSSPAPRKVIVLWDTPSVTNGKIAFYVIERRAKGEALPVNVSQVDASQARQYTDNVQPYTTYEYRIVAHTSAGGTPGPYSNITTGEGDPEGIDAPTFSAITTTSFMVHWTRPRISNGHVTHYIVRVLDTSENVTVNSTTQFTYTVVHLRSYFLYSVIVSACTVGGCGDSGVGMARTLPSEPKGQPSPTATVVSSSSLRVRWESPEYPNGAILRYELFRSIVEEPVNENFTGPTPFVRIYQGQVKSFVDTGLGIYSLQRYQVTVVTREGTNTSDPSQGYRTGPEPPLTGPTINATALNHTSVKVTWSPPAVRLLRGSAQSYRVTYTDLSLSSRPVTVFGTVAGDVTSVTVVGLKPSTDYNFQVVMDNGAGTAASLYVKERTQDGAPEGFDAPPDLYVISSSEIRVSWTPPTTPNGRIIVYNIIANGVKRGNTTGSLTKILTGLLAYELYEIRVEVCTVYKCTTSGSRSARTKSAAPTGMAAPLLTPSPTSMEVNWAPPTRPNGILSGYQLFRRKIEDCPTGPTPDTVCSYIECPLAYRLCGTVCYDPARKTCCDGALHAKDATRVCCGRSYLVRNSPTDVCCGNAFHNQRSEYQCCYGNYVRVPSGYKCCPSKGSGHVTGLGNACCGDTPYTNGSQVCVCGVLYGLQQGRQLQCCGGKVVAAVQICCEDGDRGAAYDLNPSMSCCGSQYVPTGRTLCCRSPSGNVKVYNYSSAAEKTRSNEKCCSTSKVSRHLSCCNKNGYNATSQTCADRSSGDQIGCGSSVVCNKTDATNAYCNRCDFDRTTQYCGSVNGYYKPAPTATTPPRQCGSTFTEVLNNQLNPNILSFTDTNLAPHTVYSYYVVAINDAGNVSSEVAENRTLMASPEGLDSPVPVVISSTSIRITWKPPAKHNGIIRQYRLRRIKQNPLVTKTVYTGLNLSFTDVDSLEPFTGYLYVLEACTTQCTERNAEQVVYTSQDAPAYVNATTVRAVSSTSLNVSWHKPSRPNGIIVRYNVSQIINSSYSIPLNPHDKGLDMSLLVTGLKPYTSYTFRVMACTIVGCTASPLASGLTMEAAPQGVNPPDLIVRGARAVEAIWTLPEIPNGMIRYYTLWRGNMAVYNGTDACITKSSGKISCNFTDTGLSPVTTYNYSVESTTGGGSTRSILVSATTPESSPEGIPRARLTPRSSSSIYAEWGAPSQPNGVITRYILLVDRDQHPTALVRSKLVDGLEPFTCYGFRVRACTIKGCGAGDVSTGCTLEAPPQGQGPPSLVAQEWNVVEISWSGPTTPNGILTQYEIERKAANEVPQIVCVTTRAQGLKTSCLNSGGSLRGYTVYSYRVRVRNSAGAGASTWREVRTLEGPPSGIRAPVIHVLNSTAVTASWQEPEEPNGIITHYELRYQEFPSLSNNVTVAARVTHTVFNVTVDGFKPSTSYQFMIAAINRRREGSSPPALAKTLEAPPSGIRSLQADKSPDGRSMRLYWDPPSSPNGHITGYNLYMDGLQIYRGIDRQYTVRKLRPFTAYEFQLEACTGVGCTKGEPLTIMSAEILPEGQGAPTFPFFNATVVVIGWKPPAVANGVITRYEVLRQENALNARRRRAVNAPGVTVAYATNDTNKTDFRYTDVGLKPYTRYEYKIRAVNSAGNGDSDWTTVETKQAKPAAVDTPTVTQVDAKTLLVRWVKPAQPNGVISFYFVERNASTVHKGAELSFTDRNRQPFTVYSYTVSACTGGGCTESAPGYGKTAEAAPEQVAPPVMTALSDIAIKADWTEPGKPNGIITKYELYEGNSRVYSGKGKTVSVSGRTPYTEYTYSVRACTNAGCTRSANTTIRTKEAPPEDLRAPVLTVGGSNLVRARWEPPLKLNGLILTYELRRNGSLVYTGSDVRFDDRTVAPYRVYSYVVTAVNSAGRVSSPPGFSNPTNPGAPNNVSVPVLTVLGPTAIMARWAPPALSNGIITEYYVVYDMNQGQDRREVLVGTQQTYNITGLGPYTWYEVQIKACTSSACSTGEMARARTWEAPPQGQRPPAFPSLNIAARSVQVTWFEPAQPNGLILSYRLYRREVTTGAGQIESRGPEKLIYNSTNTAQRSFMDKTIKPYSKYEFRIVSANGAGSTGSSWSVVNTLQAAPEDIPSPEITGVYADKFEILIKVPETPNGEIRNYTLVVSGRPDLATDSVLRLTVSGLEPFTSYHLRVVACTDGGCNTSATIQQRTSEGTPAEFDAPSVLDKNSTAIHLEWAAPRKPYGTILRYDVLFSQTCTGSSCSPLNKTAAGQQTQALVVGLKPYISYDVRIRAHNSRHSGLSSTRKVTTLAADPVATGNAPVVNVSSYDVSVDWSKCFILNGPLVKYVVLQNGVHIFETQLPQAVKNTFPDRPMGEYTYYVRATTLVGGTEKTVSSERITVQVPSSVTTLPSQSPQTGTVVWYGKAWFIAVIALIGIILLFIILALILRRTSGDRTVYVRERDPLPPRTKMRSRPPSMTSLYSSSSRKGGSVTGVPMHSIHQPYHTSTTALFDSSERVNSRLDKPYDQFDRYDRNDSSFNKYALDDENEWDGQMSFYDPALMNSLNNGKGDRDSGLGNPGVVVGATRELRPLWTNVLPSFLDDKLPLSDDDSMPYISLKKEQYFTDTHL